MRVLLYILISAFLVTSCASSNHVSSKRLLQKRKYTKGWHWSGRGINRASKETSADNSSHAERDKKDNQALSSQQCKKGTNDTNVATIQRETISQSITKDEKPRLVVSDDIPEDKDASNEDYKLIENIEESPEKDMENEEKPG